MHPDQRIPRLFIGETETLGNVFQISRLPP
jgi:hypothetical protein